MGLLEEAKKLREKTGLTNKGYPRQNDRKKVNVKSIREHAMKQIKREEKKEVEEPRHSISLESAKLQIERPKGASEKLKGMASIKAAIEAKLKDPKMRSETSAKHEFHAAKDRAHIGIPGLDDVMEGGFRRNTVNLVGGGAGSGKSIFCMQFLVEGIRQHNENGVYISFEENEESILKDFSRFNWNLENLIREKKLVILYYSPEQVEKVLKTGGGTVRDVIESIGAKRLVLDSLTAYTLLHTTELEKRKAVLRIVEGIEKWGITALMTSEQEPDPDKHHSTVVEFEVDGVVLLYNVRKGDIRERSLEVFKMRGTQHSAKIYPMKINDDGIVVFPEESVF